MFSDPRPLFHPDYDRIWATLVDLEHGKLIDTKSRVDLLGNRLVLIAPTDSRVDLVIRPGFDIAGALSGGVEVCTGTNSATLTLSGNRGSVLNWLASRSGGMFVAVRAGTLYSRVGLSVALATAS